MSKKFNVTTRLFILFLFTIFRERQDGDNIYIYNISKRKQIHENNNQVNVINLYTTQLQFTNLTKFLVTNQPLTSKLHYYLTKERNTFNQQQKRIITTELRREKKIIKRTRKKG